MEVPASASAAAVALAAGGEADVEGGEVLSKEIFSTYTCRSIDRGQPHPGDIAEPASLSAIPLPPSNYPLYSALPEDVVSSGKLSQLQLEGIMYTCTKHLSWLPSGERCGFFIGDGAGVGKGRQVAGIILDNYARGRRKHVWVSTSTDLYQDAVRDMRDLGAHIPVINNAQSLDKAACTPQEGVMFMTYSTLVSSVKGRSRLQQLVDWLGGPGFEGCIVLDECHKAKNFSSNEKQSTKVATCVLELQRILPRARVVYCSATGVSEVGNMAYMVRLGLWGPGSAFANFDSFLDSMKRRGVSFMEMLAMELKGDGLYVARGLSFREAEFSELECRLTSAQVAMYDGAVEVWQEMRVALAQAVAACGAGSAAQGQKSDPWKPYWAAQQRFFKLLCVSLKLPAVVKEARAALEGGFAVVIGLQSTGEAAADSMHLQPGAVCGWVSTTREILSQLVTNHFPTTRTEEAQQGQQGEEGMQLDQVAAYGQKQQQQAAAVVIEDEHCASMKFQLLERIAQLALPPNFLDQLIDELGGPTAVAEMTGRKARVVRDAKGRLVYELRAKPDSSDMDSLNIKEKQAFMDGRKLVAIVSDAASTGISLHASAVAANQRRRVHITIELPWSADKAIQQLGRSHRSNQVSSPIYKLAFTSVGGERRFAAAVARRLQGLGALTRGDRRAASGLDLSELNFDSPLGRKSLKRMYDFLVLGSPLLPQGVRLQQILEGIPEEEVVDILEIPEDGRLNAAQLVDAVTALHEKLSGCVEIMGVGLSMPPRGDTVAEEGAAVLAAAGAGGGGSGNKKGGDVRRFLNRLLGLPVARQNLLFNYFQATLAAEIRAAKQEGKYFEGVSDLPGQKVVRDGEPQVLWVDPLTGLKTMQHDIAIDRGMSFQAAAARLEHEHSGDKKDRSGFRVSRRPMYGRQAYLLALQKPGSPGLFTICRPNTGPSFFDMDVDELNSKYMPCSLEEAQEGWEALYNACLDHCMHGEHCGVGTGCQIGRRITHVSILCGSVVRIWDCLERVLARHELELSKADRTMRIVRVDPGEDQLPIIGVRYPAQLLPEVIATLSSQQHGGAAVAQESSRAAAVKEEDPTPVNPACLKKAFSAPKTLMDFFKKAPAAALSQGYSASGTGAKRPAAAPAAQQAAAPAAKKQKESAQQGSAASFFAGAAKSKAGAAKSVEPSSGSRSAAAGARAGAGAGAGAAGGGGSSSGDVVDLSVEESPEGDEAPQVLRETRRNGGSEGGGAGASTRPLSGKSGAGDGKGSGKGGGAWPGSSGGGSPGVEALTEMGYSLEQAEKALKASQGNLERAANWLLVRP